MEEHYNSLIDIINYFYGKDVSFIKKSFLYEDLDIYLKSFFGDYFSYDKLVRLNYKCYVYDKYILKLSLYNYPLEEFGSDIFVKSYYRENFDFKVDDKFIGLGVEIQDYLYPSRYPNKDELYTIYKYLRDNGYEWIDVKCDNALVYNGKVYIVDKDYIYKFGDTNYINQSRLSREFYDRYKDDK